MSIRAGLERPLAKVEVDRAAALADYEHSRSLPIQGSPQVFWPDGSTIHNRGMTDHEWVGVIPRIRTAGPGEPAACRAR